MGEAAGTAISLANSEDISIRAIDIKKLQEMLYNRDLMY